MSIKIVRKIRSSWIIPGALCLVLLLCGNGLALSFPFRSIAPGDAVPSLSFTSLVDGSTVALDSLKGNPVVVIFWGADLEAKKTRSTKIFKATEDILPFLDKRHVKVLLVNAQNDTQENMQELVAGLEEKLSAYVDPTQKAYGDLGIFIVPSALLIDKDGKVVAGLGYSGDYGDRLQGEVSILLGEKTRAEVEKELRPEVRKKPPEEKEAARLFNMALVMIERGQADSAMAKLQKAVELEPGMGEAQGQLGCLYLDQGKMEEAKKALDKSYDINPDYMPAVICDARIRGEEGQIDEAVSDLRELMFRNNRNPQLHYVVGMLLERQKKFAEAAKEYREAFELVNKRVKFK